MKVSIRLQTEQAAREGLFTRFKTGFNIEVFRKCSPGLGQSSLPATPVLRS